MLPIVVSLLPVICYLVLLIILDNYKLVKPGIILRTVFWGCIAAVIAFFINEFFHQFVSYKVLTLGIAPVVEEILKAIFPLLLLRKGRIGFIVDGAIIGFAAGCGFAFLENCYYLVTLPEQNIMVWILRGFGTSLMHGGNTAIIMIMAVIFEKRFSRSFLVYIARLPLSIMVHAFFNLFLFPPVVNMIIQVAGLPILMMIVFSWSEKKTSLWLQNGFDSDLQMLQQLQSGKFSQTKQGKYLAGFRNTFPAEVVLDFICYLKIYLELSINAKGFLLMKESGFNPKVDNEIKTSFKEMEYLERSIGAGGMAVLKPLLQKSKKELWQIYFLKDRVK